RLSPSSIPPMPANSPATVSDRVEDWSVLDPRSGTSRSCEPRPPGRAARPRLPCPSPRINPAPVPSFCDDARRPPLLGGDLLVVNMVALFSSRYTLFAGTEHEHLQPFGGRLLHRRKHVRVRVERQRDRGVAEALAHDLRVLARGEQQSGRRVAEIVEAQRRRN